MYQNILGPKYNIWLSNTGILNIDNRLACFVYVIIITRKYLQWVISKDSIPQYQYLYKIPYQYYLTQGFFQDFPLGPFFLQRRLSLGELQGV